MAKPWLKNVFGILLACLVVAASLTEEAFSLWLIPSQLRTVVGAELPIQRMFPETILRHVTLDVQRTNLPAFQSLPAVPESREAVFTSLTTGEIAEPGRFNLTLRLMGFLPLKKIIVDVLPPVELIPGGHSIGVMLYSAGVLVVGQAPVVDEAGQKQYPAKQAGIQVGDTIHRVNGQVVKTDSELAKIIQEAGQTGQAVEIEWSRNGQLYHSPITAVPCRETKRYRVGLYVRDRAAGVGTLTFLDPKTRTYGALGHVINDVDTNQQINVADGRIVPAFVKAIQLGKRGIPGEKVGVFQEENATFSGNIQGNTKVGIFGRMEGDLSNSHYPLGLPIALSAQVSEGPAEMITVIEGNKLEKFQIVIEQIMPHRSDGKGLIIRVTDARLLSLTGGIVQGMSGSPIIQNGKLVGAVTHVFINSPQSGYGCLIENMLEEAGLWQTINQVSGALSKQSPFFLKISTYSG